MKQTAVIPASNDGVWIAVFDTETDKWVHTLLTVAESLSLADEINDAVSRSIAPDA